MISKYAEWADVWQELIKFGWTCEVGDNLANYIFCTQKCINLSPKQIRRDFIEGQDYFTSQEAVQDYIRENYGWKGPEARRKSSSGTKRRKRKRKSLEGGGGAGGEKGTTSRSRNAVAAAVARNGTSPFEQRDYSQSRPDACVSYDGTVPPGAASSVATPDRMKEPSEEDYSFSRDAHRKVRMGTSMNDRLDTIAKFLGVGFEGNEHMFLQLEILEEKLFGPNPQEGRFVDRIEQLEGEIGFQ